jgi:CheY-like chemotaxis protein
VSHYPNEYTYIKKFIVPVRIGKMDSTLSVLIVDDNAKMRSIIAEIIKSRTEKVYECTDGINALEEYSIHRPDWTLMDLKMKGMDGLTATELIHQHFPKAKVMIVSQDDTPEIRQAAHHAGAAAFIPKENLLEILNALNK